MDANPVRLVHRKISKQVIGAFFDTYNELGHGFLESVYEGALAIRLHEIGVQAERQVPVAVHFHNHVVGEFRTDLLVEGCLLVEIKAVRVLTDAHDAQLLNYLKATGIGVGLLFNYGSRPDFRRRVFS